MSLKKHLYMALGLGLLFRLFSVYFVWGPQALDDYLDNLIPAWQHATGLNPDLLHDYRSPLYMWILSLWLQFGELFNISTAIAQIRWVYFFQGVISLTAVYGVYLITRSAQNSRISLIALYLTALHGLLPFASTRSFMESITMGLITLSIALLALPHLEDKKQSPWMLVASGFIILGLSSLIRFQVGVIYVSWLLYMLYKKDSRQLLFGFIFGFVLIGLEVLVDVGFGRKPFETLLAYFAFNSDPTKAPAMPWYNTSLTLLGVMYFPFTFLIYKNWFLGLKKYFPILVPVLFYVLAHSIAPHKEERYLYPILPLAFVFWAYAWAESWNHKITRYVYNPIFILLNSMILFVGCFINTQVGLVAPLALTQQTSDEVLYIDYDNIPMRNFMSLFFVRPPAIKHNLENSPKTEEILELWDKQDQLKKLTVISQLNEQELRASHQSLAESFNCAPLQEATSLSDKIMYAINPKLNHRRKPTLYFTCEK